MTRHKLTTPGAQQNEAGQSPRVTVHTPDTQPPGLPCWPVAAAVDIMSAEKIHVTGSPLWLPSLKPPIHHLITQTP
jgi:hypothetical protein